MLLNGYINGDFSYEGRERERERERERDKK